MLIERDGDSVEVNLPQRCEGKFSKELFDSLLSVEYKEVKKISFNFTQTVFIDSSTIGVLVTIDKEFRTNKTQITLRNLSEDLSELFSDTGLDLLFTIETDSGVREAKVDLFEKSVDIRLDIESEVKDDICIFHLKGIMNHPVGSRYFKQQLLLTIANQKKILLDFENLTFFDSLSVSVVLSMHKLLRETGGSLRFCNANYIVNDLFTTLNIDQIIPMHNTIESALLDWKN